MDRITRKELKSDKFATEVGHTVEYVSEHRQQFIRYGGVAAAILLIAAGIYFYNKRQHALRQEVLKAALRVQEANISAAPPSGNEYLLTFPTQEERAKASAQAFGTLVKKYPGSSEGVIAQYYLGVIAADDGKLADAEKEWKIAAETGDANYASLAKLALSGLYGATGKVVEGEKLLRSLIEKPTIMVSKEQATIALARLLGPTRPAEARKLLEPLRGERSAVSRAALTALTEIR